MKPFRNHSICHKKLSCKKSAYLRVLTLEIATLEPRSRSKGHALHIHNFAIPSSNSFHKVKLESFDLNLLYTAFLVNKVFVFGYYCKEYP